MNKLSNRINALAESATLAMAQKARDYKAQGIDIISLSLGEPDFKTPKHIQEAAKEAIDEQKYFSYPPVGGYGDLREKIAGKLSKINNIPVQAENIVVSAGAKHTLANIFMSILNPGDEVIVFSPYWVSYAEIVKLAEGKPVFVRGTLENDFKVTAEQLEEAITDRTKAVLFSSPCNPTGSVFTRSELEAIAEVVKKHPDMLVVSDEIYEHINFTGEHVSMAALPGMLEQTVTVNGFSKGYAMTGWRVGYMAAPLWLAKGCTKMQGQVTSGICSIAQRAALKAIDGDMTPTKEMAGAYLRRRDMVKDLLDDIPGIKTNLPQGAFYIFPDVSDYFGKSDGETIIQNAGDLCMYILENAHVSTVTGEAFGAGNCIRISYAASDEDLKEALKRMKEVLAKLK